jgi:hypothetical protein
MTGGDVAKWTWFGEPLKDLATGVGGLVTLLRQRYAPRARVDVSPMSSSWLREHEYQSAKHTENR